LTLIRIAGISRAILDRAHPNGTSAWWADWRHSQHFRVGRVSEEFPEFDDRQGSMPAGALKFSSTSFEAHSRVAIEPIKSDCPHTESIEEGYERTVSRDTRVRGGA
jgi:hypothetical protein